MSEACPWYSQLWLGPLVIKGTLVEIPSCKRAGHSARSGQRCKSCQPEVAAVFLLHGISFLSVPSFSFLSLLHSLHFSSSLLLLLFFLLFSSFYVFQGDHEAPCISLLSHAILPGSLCLLFNSVQHTHPRGLINIIVFKYSPVRLPLIALAS